MIRPSTRALRPPAVAFVLAFFCSAAGTQAALGQVVSPAQAAPAQPAAPDAGADATVQTTRAYRIRQGDEVLVTVFGEPTLTPPSPLRVVQGGTIALPLVGEVALGGLTTSQAGTAVARALRRFVRSPQVTVAIYSVAPIEALVLGNVKVPGKYTLPPPARLTDVLAAAGGLGPTDGDYPTIRLETPEGTTSNVSLQNLLHDGDETLNVAVESGETVYIPSPTTFTVVVSGAVDHPGDVLMHDGDDVAMAVARAGASANQSSDLNHVTVGRGTNVQTVNLYPILQKGDLTHDVKVQKGDSIFVPSSPKHTGFGDIFFSLVHFLPY